MTNQDPKTDARDTLAKEQSAIDESIENASDDAPAERPDAVELQKQLDDANDRALRSHAELENFRKRARREIEDERRYAALSVINDLLGVLDNLERAVDAAGKSESSAGLLDGVKMVAQQFNTVLQQHHCRRIETIGRPFDPNLHEAAGQEPSTNIPAGHVARELRSGYQLHDRVVRPAQVLVAVAPAAKQEET
jgi:molecular chaperone GrpE